MISRQRTPNEKGNTLADRAAEKLPLRHPAVLFAIVLVLLVVFILENSHQVDISFMGAHGHLPLEAALLLAAVPGILQVAIVGASRMITRRT